MPWESDIKGLLDRLACSKKSSQLHILDHAFTACRQGRDPAALAAQFNNMVQRTEKWKEAIISGHEIVQLLPANAGHLRPLRAGPRRPEYTQRINDYIIQAIRDMYASIG